MCHVIVTCRSMLWTLLSIVVAFAELVAIMSADWLVGVHHPSQYNASSTGPPDPKPPTLGLYSRCIRVSQQKTVQCGPYAADFTEIASGFWQASIIFLVVGIFLLSIVGFLAVFSMCFQSILGKSIFNVCGLLQGIAGRNIISDIFQIILRTIYYYIHHIETQTSAYVCICYSRVTRHACCRLY